ncbi:MAG: PadR family transcriptional regulator [Myxococcota bacterium]
MSWHHHARRRHASRRSRRFGPWQSRGRFFGPGEVRLALLSLIGERPQHGYQLMKGLQERSGGTYRASAGTIYPTLQQLEDEELIVSDSNAGKRVYELSDAGRAELEQNSDAVDRIWERAEDWESWSGMWEPDASELWRPGLRTLKSALRALHRSESPDRADEVREILDRARRELDQLDG